jgi:hypothetical protein
VGRATDKTSQAEERKEERALETFHQDAEYLFTKWPTEMSVSGDDVLGFSLSRKPDGWLLVIRGKVDGIRQVAFLFGETTTDCVALAVLKVRAGTLRWHDDNYA